MTTLKATSSNVRAAIPDIESATEAAKTTRAQVLAQQGLRGLSIVSNRPEDVLRLLRS